MKKKIISAILAALILSLAVSELKAQTEEYDDPLLDCTPDNILCTIIKYPNGAQKRIYGRMKVT